MDYFIGKSHFDEDSTQNYLAFQTILRCFTLDSNWISKWKSKGLSKKNLEDVTTADNTLTPSVRLRFTGSVL